MNPSTAQARALVVALAKHGVTDVVMSPGSRNSPLSIACFQAQAVINLTVRIDERTAAFTALGMAKRTNRPVVVMCTSGTAAANAMSAPQMPTTRFSTSRRAVRRATNAWMSVRNHRR